ncbi:hypothetical protein [Novosphingobium aromaticivorans]|uniref:hypothetical protein n=1 Tax=Novosphingobium aromaticivorans TaxID=48935 RepID=UPI0015A31105|nr:hypothetical protein [Novosphingobium aromaticivorans]
MSIPFALSLFSFIVPPAKEKAGPAKSGTDSFVAPPVSASGQRRREGWGGLKVY